ncbi:phosphoribosylamine--glycine ligase [Gracilinema caldarium]|uniref:Phosphoribosylamine--glycine ligase n=1 Tax=Gracilinema caldarium (strain ATCC 51460 / DSM 7334 / H1) TaxID=744872 RepID=F8F480_GRAC1|nr:phosphoribosylamine--glycine ligase [Gracilinema caldarium]AEJ20527.1 Phosphoribosylamine--glycine ligase [Gracilinema caldarium DSM 7334]
MKVLVIGSGGREHALAWKLAQSVRVTTVYVAPGNGGTALEHKCRNVPVPGSDPSRPEAQEYLVDFVRREGIELTVVGPEAPLAAGLADRFTAAGLPVVGPEAKTAQLESSKAYAKAFMAKYGVRTARSTTVNTLESAMALVTEHFAGNPPHKPTGRPLVIKADGLAAGKGVVITDRADEASATIEEFMEHRALGTAGTTLVIEEYLEGKEVSILAAVQAGPDLAPGTARILPFIPARDHKRRYDGSQGPNTGGMGAIAPVADFSEAARTDFEKHILEPTLRGLEAEGLSYRGFIFFGLMVQDNRCYLLEYNVRLGDPETQAVLPLMGSDLAELCLSIAGGTLHQYNLTWKPGFVCAPVAVAEGYPGTYRKGDPISIERDKIAAAGAQVFIAGASMNQKALDTGTPDSGDGEGSLLRTTGGRVLAVSAYGTNLEDARSRAYQGMDGVHFTGMGFRRDIGTC